MEIQLSAATVVALVHTVEISPGQSWAMARDSDFGFHIN